MHVRALNKIQNLQECIILNYLVSVLQSLYIAADL